MINAPQGMAAGLPVGHAGSSSCAVTQAPPTLGGGLAPAAAAGVSFPAAPAATATGPSFGTPSIPTTGASTAALGAATTAIGAGPFGSSPLVNVNFPSTVAAPFGTGFAPSTNVIPAATPVPGVDTAPIATNGAGVGATFPAATGVIGAVTSPATAGFGTTPAVGTTGVGANAAPRPLTSLAPGGNAQDAALVERTLGVLRQSPSGAQIVDRLLAVNARVNVISDQEFQAMGHGSAHAFYDPKIDTMFLRRSDLADDRDVKFAAIALAHEGTHLLDDVAKLADPFINDVTARVNAAGGLGTAQGAAIRDQGIFELTMIKETRAFLFAGSVARELGEQLPTTDPTSTAVAGNNDQATYNAVWQRLLQSSYNPEGRTAAPRNL